MCLYIKIKVRNLDQKRLEAVQRASRDAGGFTIHGDSPPEWVIKTIPDSCQKWLKKIPWTLSIAENGPCACNMLSARVDLSCPTWGLLPESIIRLSTTIEKIHFHFREGFAFRAFWVGSKPTKEQFLPLAELMRVIEENRIEAGAIYYVR